MPWSRRLTELTAMLAVSVSGGSMVHAQPKGLDGHKIVRVLVDEREQLETLLALDTAAPGFEIWSEAVGLGFIDVRVSPNYRSALDAAGLPYQVVIDDLQALYDEMFRGPRGGDFFESNRTYDEHVAFLNDLVTAHPKLAQMVNLGLSVEGRPLWAIHITGPGEDKPAVMYHGAQHGNEFMGAFVVAYAAQCLLGNYDTDPDVADLVDHVEWFLMPIMNPDGYAHGTRRNANNIDLNRNWDGPGAGTDPFSQPETAALRDFFLAHPNVRAYLDFHTFGYMILWPWGYTAGLCDDHWTYDLLGHEMYDLILTVHGTSYDRIGPIYTTIYPVHGVSLDYTYGVRGIWSIAFELGDSHTMPASAILPTSEDLLPVMMYFSEWVYDCNGNGLADAEEIAAGTSIDCNTNGTPDECEPYHTDDFDGDGLADPCDPDIDNDGIPNREDLCDYTPQGMLVHGDGTQLSDVDIDCDVDLWDYRRFVDHCFDESGPHTTAPPGLCRDFFDYDGDQHVDLTDLAGFQQAFTGEQP